MKAKFKAILALAFVMCASSAFSATYYVDGTRGSDSNAGTSAAPWKTMQYAGSSDNNRLNAGDTVIVRAGTYNATERGGIFFRKDGITYKADGDVYVSNTVSVDDVNGAFTWGFQILADDVTVEGFDISGVAGCIDLDGAQNITIKNCVLHDAPAKTSGGFPVAAGVYIEGASWATVTGCTIYNIQTLDGYVGAGIFNMGAYSASAGSVHSSTFTNNVIYNVEGDAIACRGGATNDKIYNNTLVDVRIGFDVCTGSVVNGSATIRNNIVVRATENAIWNNGTATNDHNLFYDCEPCHGVSFGDDTVTEDPMFGDDGSYDFTLTQESPAIDAGVDVGIAYNGQAPDLGAFESIYDSGPKCVVSGVVTRKGGVYFPEAPVKGAVITAGDVSATTDAQGRYSMTLPYGETVFTIEVGGVDFNDSANLASETAVKNFELDPVTDQHVYYISTEGDDWGGDGSEENPFASIDAPDAEVQGLLEPGDTVIVKEGIYYDSESLRGYEITTQGASALAPIIFKAQGDVIIDMSPYMEDSAQEMVSGIYAGMSGDHSVSGLVFDGFKFENCQFGIYLRDDFYDGVVTNCTFNNFHRPAETGDDPMAYYVGGVCFSVADNCFCHHNIFSNIVDDTAEVVAAITMPGASNVAIYNNTFDNTTTVVRDWVVDAGPNAFVNNIVMNMSETALYAYAPGLITASYNLFENCPQAIGDGVIDNGGNFIGVAGLDSDYVPVAGESMAIDAGIDVGFDYEGSAPDMGAKEGAGAPLAGYYVITSGTVKNTEGLPVAKAVVTLNGYEFVSDNSGSFLSVPMKVVESTASVTASKKGYYDYSGTVTLTSGDNSIDIVLRPNGEATYNTYYVDGTNGSDENDGSEANPFATIQHADEAGILEPGDVVFVKAGTYSGPDRDGIVLSECSGESDAPIRYMAEDGVVITNNEQVDPSSSTWGIIVTADNILFHNFEVTGTYGLIFAYGAQGIIVDGCTLQGTVARGDQVPSSAAVYVDMDEDHTKSGQVEVRNCEIYDISNGDGRDASAIYNMAGYFAPGGKAPASYYHNNIIRDVRGNGILVRGTDSKDKVYNNDFVRCDYGMKCNTQGAEFVGTAIVRNNLFVHVPKNPLWNNDNSGAIDSDYNVFADTGGLWYVDLAQNDIVTAWEVIFVDCDNNDFNLAAGSPAIDSGVDVGLPYEGTAIDRGAIEYSASAEAEEIDNMDDLLAAEIGTKVETTFDLIATNGNDVFNGGHVYVQTEDRLKGIKFEIPEFMGTVNAGDRVRVKGTVSEDLTGKYISVDELVSATAGDVPQALGMVKGVTTNDVLVRVWGKVVSVSDDTFIINNGSGDVTCCLNPGLTAAPAVGSFVTVTGAATEMGVLIRTNDDVMAH